MATVLPLRTAWIAHILSQASLRDVQRQRCWKRGTCGGDGGRVFGTAVRHDWAIFQCRWQARFDAHLNCLQGHRRQPIARSGKFVRRAYSRRTLDCAYICFLPSCAMHKDNAVGNVVAETGRDSVSLYDFGTTERSFSAVERWGSTLTWTVCMAADSEERQNTTCFFAEGVGLWRNDGLMLSPIVEHTSVWEGVGGRGEILRGFPQWNTKDQLPKPQTATVATAQWPK